MTNSHEFLPLRQQSLSSHISSGELREKADAANSIGRHRTRTFLGSKPHSRVSGVESLPLYLEICICEYTSVGTLCYKNRHCVAEDLHEKFIVRGNASAARY